MTNEFLVSGRGVNGTYAVGRASDQGVWNCNTLGQTDNILLNFIQSPLNLFFALLAKVRSDLVCNRPAANYLE